jgi:short-subunit dehydrogenase
MTRARDIRGKTVIVTGASSGIGRRTAWAFGRAGCRVAVIARRSGLLETLAESIESCGGTALVLPADLGDADEAAATGRRALEAFGSVDILVNNAGVGYTGLVDEIPVEEYRRLMDVNFLGAVALTKSVLPAMRAQRSGHIINVSSVIGARATPLSSAYCATKFALNGFTEALRVEVTPDHIDVSLVQPGLTRTDFGSVAERGTRYARARPSLRQRFAQSPEHVAAVIVQCARHPRRRITLTAGGRLLLGDAVAPWLVDRGLGMVAGRAVRSLPRGVSGGPRHPG